ncbi:type III-A CRISPR-associated RAMP protein Csm5 [Geminocystis herdmanii]|uniref:type III-A CRISPR-associated RAMP protein Csm5 n=1 Tax=Geminocystis herdmanii TaxID=669359 RepID=UPI000344DF5C|nr:type III-A CRISPR-associated RAMP protein Csm5 [Geminocystis herdmanii]
MTTTTLQPLTFTKNYQTAKIRLTTPILRIGGAVSQLNPYEYIQTSSKVYLPNQEALARVLLQRGKLHQYIQKIEDKEDIKPLLDDIDENWHNLTDDYGNLIFPPIGISRKWVDGKITDLRPMIRNGFGEPYIPGSSIKGAIRSSIAFFLLKHQETYNTPIRISQIEARLREKIDNGELRRQAKFADDRLFMSDLFENFSLKYNNKNYNPRTGPNTDFLRALNISDSLPLLEEKIPNKKTGKSKTYNIPVTTEVIVSSHFQDNNAKYKASLYTEMIFNVRTEFTINLDLEMLSWFNHNQNMRLPFNNLEELMNICQEFSQTQWDGEYDYWNNINDNKHQGKDLDFELIRNFYEEEKCPYQLRLGWGTGMGGTTINWLIDDDLRGEIRDTCGLKAPNFQAPKSRRTILNREADIRYIPGWAKLKII